MAALVGAADVELATRFQLPRDLCAEFLLEQAAGRLQLRATRDGAPGPLFVDFSSNEMQRRRAVGRQLPLVRAVCGRGDAVPSVLDATAGLGRDAFTLWALGCAVTAVERSPVIAALLEDGLQRANADIRLVVADTRRFMAELAEADRPEVVYLDPMFPERRKSAAVKKEMQYMQALLGEHEVEQDIHLLFAAAMKCALRRVVIKRPTHAGSVVEAPKPNHTFEGKTIRFDVYLTG